MKKRIVSVIAVFCMLLTVLPVVGSAATELTLTKTVIGNTGATIAVSGGSGTVTAQSSNTGVATVSVSGTTVTVTGVSGQKGVVTIGITRGTATAEAEVAIGYTTFSFSGRSVTVYAGSDENYEVIGIEKASETEFTGAEGTGEMTVSTDANGNSVYTVASGYELCVGVKKKGGTYAFNGSSDYANIAVKKEATKDAVLLFDGLTLKSQFTSPLTVKKDSTAKVYVNLLKGSVNALADTAVNNGDSYGPTTDGGDGSNQYYAESAVIKCKTASDVTISGGGALTITAAAKNGIKSGADAYFTIAGGTVNVTAPNSCLGTENQMLISGGIVTLRSTGGGDGIKAESDDGTLGTVYVTGGQITVNGGDEGILARSSVNISGGTFNITCDGDGIKAEDGASTPTTGDVSITGGDFTIISKGDGISAFNVAIEGGTFNITPNGGYTNSSYNGDTMDSAKGIKGEVEVTIEGGTFNVSAPDDAIHCDGNLNIYGGTYTINTRDDGLHANGNLNFGIKGASNDLINMTINNSYEGMEGADIYLNSGNAAVYSTDDVINAANKNLSNHHFTINEYGGVYRLYTSGGDGVDSNGGCYFRGGDLEVYSTSNTSNDPLDTEDTLALYGGVTLGCGMNQMQGSPSAGIYVEFTNCSIKSGYSIVIKNASGTVLKSTQAYFKSSSNTATYLVFSHPALASGSTYYLYINGSSSAKTGTATGAGVDITPWCDLDSGNTNVYEQVTTMSSGSRYVITNASMASTVYTLAGTTSTTSVQSTMSTVTGGYTFGSLSANNLWYMDDAGHIYNTVNGVNYYLAYSGSSSGWSTSYSLSRTTDVSSAAAWTVSPSGSGALISSAATSSGGGFGPGGQPGMSTNLYLYCSSGTWRLATSASSSYICYLYAPAVAQAALTGTTYYVAENDAGFSMANIQAETSISYRSSRNATAQTLAWNNSHISYSWSPAFNSAVNGTYVLTVMYDGIAFGTVTVKIVGDQQTITITFTGAYNDTVVIAVGDSVTLPTAPEGFYYTYFINGVETDAAGPFYADTTITVVLNEIYVEPVGLPGDVDCNGEVNFADISVLYLYMLGLGELDEQGRANADYDGDGSINFADISAIYSYIMGV